MLAAIPFPELSPEIFTIRLGEFAFSLRWYALAYIVGLLIGWRTVVGLMRRPSLWPASRAPMAPTQVEDLLFWIILGVILGGRLGFVLFYQPDFYLQNPAAILRLWEGGMAFHGGFAGVVIAALLYCRRHGIPALSLADALALATPPGLLLGRLANFINGELWGRPTEAPWGVVFPGALAQECAGVVGPCARHPSQLYEAALEGLILGALLWALVLGASALKRPGLLTGVFLLGYGLARAAVELVRQPDAQFAGPGNPVGYALQLGEAGLTMGQILTLPMILAGLFLIARTRPGSRLA
ncbi:prolipoprotein diacylglyceryl transferase [Poseidonocella sedimentorum]|uniref:Phosphatidylglycerol--prolipoprotein diacylglyceryl transferase n=1 Tax=Poseidonocella sedimentorum TaxID=871652 RepID=A0A1I6E8D1_9RHOB|nr:prolipoprotein diacylglyceryl transferase [Poseidonocella sedimentorum]SFR13976.1 Prolipoprotein diacylglyceryl transferase [Poseidonocella sedimentorum]